MFSGFELFGKTISTYFIAALAGIFVAGIYTCRIAKKRGYDDNDLIVTLLIAAVGALIGGHMLYGITNISYWEYLLSADSVKKFLDYSVLIFGGSVFYGGLIGAIVAAEIYIRKKSWDFGAYSDMITPAIPLFHFFGRIGCFFGGCCYGIECKLGITFHNSMLESANGVSRFPIQLAEAAFNICLFLFLNLMLKKGKLKGRLFYLYLLCYAPARFCFEFLRGDEYRGFLFGFSTSQIISIIVFIGAFLLLAKKKYEDSINTKKHVIPKI